jgi:hypothetical protein
MDLETLQENLERLTLQVDEDNFNDYFDKFSEVIESYRSNGGLGKPLYEYLTILDKKYGSKNKGVEEILCDTLNRLSGYASPNRRLFFGDFDNNNEE